MEKTKNHNNFTVNFAMAYSGRQEIIDAFKKIFVEIKKNKLKINDINEATVSKYLYLKSEPDLVIRPGGEVRTSNFLTWESVYSEWIFFDKLWPEFTKEDLLDCIKEFNKRERRFGE